MSGVTAISFARQNVCAPGRRGGWLAARGWVSVTVAALLSVILAACATIERLPAVPLAMGHDIRPLDIPYARFYYDGDPAELRALAHEVIAKSRATRGESSDKAGTRGAATFLAISGGGDDGAFGAGLLVGWTAHGDRPEFSVVTGISTGALSAPFAFLGPDYDHALKSVYTETAASDIFSDENPVVSIISGDSAADTTPLKNLISKFIDEQTIRRIAQEYDKGRLLLVATTNLDQARSVIWNIGAIAQSTDPRARALIIEVLRASASIPGAFPPVMLDVTVDGKHYEEMHVDGGAMTQMFLYPPSLRLKQVEKKTTAKKDVAYIIRNGRLFRAEQQVKRQTLAIAGQAIATMTAANGMNDLYRIYLTTERDGVDYNLIYLDDEFNVPYEGPFNKIYMNTLFEFGFRKGAAGIVWHKQPPGYEK
jgi:predicted acylesterase/phospholipase RssA